MKTSPAGGFRLLRLRSPALHAPSTVKSLGGDEPRLLVDHPAAVRHFSARLRRMYPTEPVGLTDVHEDPLWFRFRQYSKPTLYSLERFRSKAVVHELLGDLSYQQKFPQTFSRKSIPATTTNNRHHSTFEDTPGAASWDPRQSSLPIAACAAANRATGTRYGEQDT